LSPSSGSPRGKNCGKVTAAKDSGRWTSRVYLSWPQGCRRDRLFPGQADQALFADGGAVREFEPFRRQAEKRLTILEAATGLDDLRALPSNRLEALHGGRKGQFSIRVNLQWRICFEWPHGSPGPRNVEIVDYH